MSKRNPANALIKSYDMKISQRWSCCIELELELSIQDGGAVCFETHGVYSKGWDKNQLGYAIKKVLDIVGVESLKDVVGKPVRALFSDEGGAGSEIIGIGHFLREEWFIPESEVEWAGTYEKHEFKRTDLMADSVNKPGVPGGGYHIED